MNKYIGILENKKGEILLIDKECFIYLNSTNFEQFDKYIFDSFFKNYDELYKQIKSDLNIKHDNNYPYTDNYFRFYISSDINTYNVNIVNMNNIDNVFNFIRKLKIKKLLNK